MLGGLGMGELAIILVIVIIVFGATRLPMIGSGLGKGISNFKKEIDKNKDKKEKGLEELEKEADKNGDPSSEKTD